MAVEFRLIGNLTIRQFFFLGIGLGLAYIFSKTILPFFIRWPLIIAFGFAGAASAFLPIQDRSFDIWVRNFIKSVYSPTQRIWRKDPEPPSYFLNEYAEILRHEVVTLAPTKSRKKLAAYLEGIHEEQKNKIDEKMDGFIKNIKYDIEPSEKLKEEEKEKRKRRVEMEKRQREDAAPLEPAVVKERPASNGVKKPERISEEIRTGKEILTLPKRKQIELRKKLGVSEGAPLIITSKEDILEMPKIKRVIPGRELKILPLSQGEIILPARERKIEPETTDLETRRKIAIEKALKAQVSGKDIKETTMITPTQIQLSSPLMERLSSLQKTIEDIRSKQVGVLEKEQRKTPPFKAAEELVGVVPKRELGGTAAEEEVKKETEDLKLEIQRLTERTEELKSIAEKVPGAKPSDLDTIEFYKEQIRLLEEENKYLEGKLSKKKGVEKLLSDLENQNIKYQKELSLIKDENKKLTLDISMEQKELSGLKKQGAGTEAERKLQERRIKLAEERLKALAEEKKASIQRIDELKRQVGRLKQKAQVREQLAEVLTQDREKPREGKVKKIGEEEAKKEAIKPLTNVPNIISGYVKDNKGQLLEGAVVIVKDNDGDPVRALKTNDLGQFIISTPLPNGVFRVGVSFMGLTFDIVEIETDGSTLPPLEFRAQG